MSAANVLPDTIPDDPSEIGWPVGFALEIAMNNAPAKEICLAYGVSRAEWNVLINTPEFVHAVEEAVKDLEQEGAMFKVKLKGIAEGVLPRLWKLMHSPLDTVPANVQADLGKFVIRAAGYDASVEQKAKAAGIMSNTNALQINIDLGD